ncbi:30S ribosomal protein S6 [Ktedonobacter racemifer]|uniref:Small ribosomal subunit protein bS6 n=1 Tax=Ktedonobacter racemifer DSM 44963 TaxID=485913 RepID=D6THA1_KTERA|nr:30S ribosomal protein S6 [Ktedonobacter racemifer]EFH90843.1 ribosomal protein S6 [Ktedonobacter racemifer DSM 44963]
MRRDYELAFILNPEVSEEETRTILDRVEQIVANYGGQIVKVNNWGRRRLAYPIERHRDGIYVFIDMILTPETVAEIERTLKVSESVLRYMTKKRDPKAVQKEREDREAREARAAEAAAAAAAAPASEGEVPTSEQETLEVTTAEVATAEASTAEASTESSPATASEEGPVPPGSEESVEA